MYTALGILGSTGFDLWNVYSPIILGDIAREDYARARVYTTVLAYKLHKARKKIVLSKSDEEKFNNIMMNM